jgi:chaperonin cofactor prefoldin
MEEIIRLRREEAEQQEEMQRLTKEASQELAAMDDLRRFNLELRLKQIEREIELEKESAQVLNEVQAQAEITANKELEDMMEKKKAASEELDLLEDIRDGYKSIGATIVEAFMSGKSAADAFKSALSSLLQKLASRSLDKFLDLIFKSGMKGAPSLFENFMSNVPVLGNIFGKRAGGGPVNSGAPYLVGEKGPELFVPSMAGQVVPSYATSGTSTINNYNIQAIDVKSFEERIMGSNRAVWAANAYAQKSLSPRGRT